MRNRFGLVCAVILLVLGMGAATARAEETIVFLRHGEKPSGGYGQLTCQGFNRSLALPDVLLGKFGRPNILYAPNPATKIPDAAGNFYYDRPLATLEPLAVKLQMDIWSKYGYNDIASLQSSLITSSRDGKTIFVAWEHVYLAKVVQNIMNAYGGGVSVPAWASGDYDSLYIVHVDYSSGSPRATFERAAEGLNGLSTSCPF
jgi:hypothetical protein